MIMTGTLRGSPQPFCDLDRPWVLLLLQVGVDLAAPGFMPSIVEATQDLDIQIVFCNAGYMLTGFFHTL